MRFRFVLAVNVLIGTAAAILPGAPAGATQSSPGSLCTGIAMPASADIADAIASNPEGTRFCLGAGVHRLTRPLVPKDGQKFIGETGAVISGAKVLRSPVQVANYWVYTGQSQESEPWGPPGTDACRDVPGRPPTGQACTYNESVFLDDVSLWQVLSLTELTPGTFYFDYKTDSIFIADDPSGHTVEATAGVGHAFGGSASDVVIRRLTIEKFPNRMQSAALDGGAGTHWTIAGNDIRLNHGIGLWASPHGVVRNNHVHHNGQMGMAGQGADIVVSRNEIDHNGIHGPNWAWEGGGTKWVRTTGLTVTDNYSHDNIGIGLWTDGYNIDTLYDRNRVADNLAQGIVHEISYDAVISNNDVSGNGFGHEATGSYWGAGIEVWQSPNVEVYDNVVTDNAHGIMAMMTPRGSGPHGVVEVRNLYVHDNVVTLSNPNGRSGLAIYGGSGTTYYTSKNNRFAANTYRLNGVDGPHFVWDDKYVTGEQWRAYDNDVDGTFSRVAAARRSGRRSN